MLPNVITCRPYPWKVGVPVPSRVTPLLPVKVLSLIDTSPVALIVAPIRRLSLAWELFMVTFRPLVISKPVSSIKPGDSVVFPLKMLLLILTSRPAFREAPHRKLSLAVTDSRSIVSGVTTVRPYPRNSEPLMILVPEKTLLLIATRPPALMLAPTSRLKFANTFNRETDPSATISSPVTCRRPVRGPGLLKLLLAMDTFPADRIIAH